MIVYFETDYFCRFKRIHNKKGRNFLQPFLLFIKTYLA